MAEGADVVALLPSIAALPPITARQIGSGQVLIDPSSVVKELTDNALDARAKSIFVDITANTIDSIQVKDDGHGIPSEDRPLVCRRYCTSKICDFQDLRELGGKWLGFRGEALSSMAEMSGTFQVTTRVEGEPVAVKVKYNHNGELASIERESHPVGTTVKVTNFFEHIPVRKQTAIKTSAKCLAKIRRLMQAYALARPTIRFRLRVLKTKNNKADFVYAPKSDATLEDAVLKVISKDCALQCEWTALESDGFEIHAFLPNPAANGPKIANQGAFVSIDGRPVSSSRGTIKQVVATFKDRLRKSNPLLSGTKDPFFCMNIMCPPDSYDPNIEPAKDDVMFEDAEIVLAVVNKLLMAYYPEAGAELEDDEASACHPECYEPHEEELPTLCRSQASVSVYQDVLGEAVEKPTSEAPHAHARWRSSMYGIDQDDLEFLQDDQGPVVEEEEGRRAAEVSNPWTIARMNAATKPKQPLGHGQLSSPAKSQRDATARLSSPDLAISTPNQLSQAKPLTPQTSSRMNMGRSPLNEELESSIQHLPPPSSESGRPTHVAHSQADNQQSDPQLSPLTQFSPMPHEMPPQTRLAPHHGQRKGQPYNNKPFAPPAQSPNDTWYGKPRRGAQSKKQTRHQNGPRDPDIFPYASDGPSRPALDAAEGIVGDRLLQSDDNTDIRDFFQRGQCVSKSNANHIPSFTPINPFPPYKERGMRMDYHSRESSAELQSSCSTHHATDELMLNPDRGTSAEPHKLATTQFRAYADREGYQRASSVGSDTSILFKDRSTDVSEVLDMRSDSDRGTRPEPRNMARQFPAHHNTLVQSPIPRPLMKPQKSTQVPATALKPSSTHETAPKPPHRRLRHRTTTTTNDPKRRTTNPSKNLAPKRLPTPPIQNIILHLPISVYAIIQSALKLDMHANTPEWGSSEAHAYAPFPVPETEKKIRGWVVRLEGMLDEKFERKEGVDVRGEVHEGIQRAVDGVRKERDGIMVCTGVEE